MLLNIRQRNWLTLVIGLVGLLILLNYRAVLPVHAQESDFEKIQVRKQTVEVRDAEGNDIGSGQFRAYVINNRLGRISGTAVLQMPAFTIEIEFTGLDEILYEGGSPVGVVLSGRGTLSWDGQTKTFAATVTVSDGATTTIPDCLIWDIPEPAVLENLIFDAQGRLEFRDV